MIEIRYSPKGLAFQIDFERPQWRFKGPAPKSVEPPRLPSVLPPPSEIISQAAAVGEREGSRFRRRSGRRSTRLTTGVLVPANIERKTLLGGS